MDFEIITLDSILNCRDLGGIINKDGKRIKSKMLLRSADLTNATANDLSYLHDNYNLKTVIDFRSPKEQSEHPDVTYPGIKHIGCSAFDKAAPGISRENDAMILLLNTSYANKVDSDTAKRYMMALYEILGREKYCLTQYSYFVHLLLNKDEGAFLWHCAMGKDRAGIGSAIILSLLDVDWPEIYQDYMYSNIGHHGDREASGNYLDYFDYVFPEYIESWKKSVIDTFGSFDAYYSDGLKLTKEEIDQLKAIYLE